MLSSIKHIFFDLDHTLWDFEKNARETLIELYLTHGFDQYTTQTSADFVKSYEIINKKMWSAYEKGEIDKQTLRTKRFNDSLLEIGVPFEKIPQNIWEEYLAICPLKTNLMDGAIESLRYLSLKYKMAIITNGFKEVQRIKIEKSGLSSFFDEMIISEEAGFQKPHTGIFALALNAMNSTAEQSVMIGDNLDTDIRGALDSGMKAIQFNHSGDHLIFYGDKHIEINHLSQLKNLL